MEVPSNYPNVVTCLLIFIAPAPRMARLAPDWVGRTGRSPMTVQRRWRRPVTSNRWRRTDCWQHSASPDRRPGAAGQTGLLGGRPRGDMSSSWAPPERQTSAVRGGRAGSCAHHVPSGASTSPARALRRLAAHSRATKSDVTHQRAQINPHPRLCCLRLPSPAVCRQGVSYGAVRLAGPDLLGMGEGSQSLRVHSTGSISVSATD